MEITNNQNSIRYRKAAQRVKKLKSFYSHLIIYILVNLLLFFLNLDDIKKENTIWTWEIWATPVFWGIGLAAHAISVFKPEFSIGKDWEERKTRELMDKYK